LNTKSRPTPTRRGAETIDEAPQLTEFQKKMSERRKASDAGIHGDADSDKQTDESKL
jgi:hypothetical protein